MNLGSPAAPTYRAVRRFLAQFLSDRRVVELPAWLWRPLLHTVVLTARPVRSAALYRRIWTADGSPLAVHTRAQAAGLAARLTAQGTYVHYAMTYGAPGIGAGLDALLGAGARRLVLLPLYPQYAASTTGAAFDAAAGALARVRALPELHLVRDFHLHGGYLAAVQSQVLAHWARHGRGDHLVLSFHGLPRRAVARGDPYADQCAATAHALAGRLGLGAGDWTLAFQSRFGLGRWLGPATEKVLLERVRAGQRRLDVCCPGFVADCLETLEELGVRAAQRVAAARGALRVVPCVNAQPAFLDALADIATAALPAG